jgi:HAD hydrolase, family IA, variant 1
MKKLVVFDLDGTLLNTIADLGNACNYALKEMGYSPHPLTAYNYMVGNGVRRLMERAEPDATPETIDLLLGKFREYYDEHCTDLTRPYPGIPELLAELQDKGVAVAVTSNKYQFAVNRIISHYFGDITFAAILGEVPDRPKKPDPSIVFEALNIHPTPKREVLYVGDSAVDIETARRACVESVGVTWGFRPVSELRSAYADHIVSDPSEILKYVCN